MTEVLLAAKPIGGWTTEDLDRMPVSNIRYELTDGALTVSPSTSNLHQSLVVRLATRLEALAPSDIAVAVAVEIRFARQLTRIPDLMLVRSDEPGRHWFAPAEVIVAVEIEHRATTSRTGRPSRRSTPSSTSRTTGGSNPTPSA
ncbi:MAG: Uma2 family endonuclease [Geodermatophilaceae bacterium]|nr:Uma2 family endonuclease [Geodermatophilaceae bacterium]